MVVVIILGLPLPRLLWRLISAAIIGSINMVVWYIIPSTLFGPLGTVAGLDAPPFLAYALPITAFSVVKTIFRERWFGSAAGGAGGVLTAFYLYTMARGGVLSLSVLGVGIRLEFPILLYLIMLPPLLFAVTNIWSVIHSSSSARFELEEIVEP